MKKKILLTSILMVGAISFNSPFASAGFFDSIADGFKKIGKGIKTGAGSTVNIAKQIGKDAYNDRFTWAQLGIQGASQVVGSAAYGAAAGATSGGGGFGGAGAGPHFRK